MGMIDAGKKLFLNTLSAAAIAISGCSQGTVENNYVCDEQGCHPGSPTAEQPSSSSPFATSTLETKVTNTAGSTTIFNQQIKVTDENNQPLSQVTVYGLQDSQQAFYLAVDQTGEYYPTAVSKNNGTLESHLEISLPAGKPGSQNGADGIVNLILKAVNYSKKILATLSNANEGDFISQTKQVNLYCMSLEQMKTSYILVPAGILFLATPEGIAGKTVKIANTAALNQIFDAYIRTMYGDEEGYLVAVPRTAIDLCGENYESAVCPITTESLSETLWSKTNIPVWQIRGSCTPKSTSSTTTTTPPPANDAQNGNNNDYNSDKDGSNNNNNDTTFYDSSTGLQWQKNASTSTMTKTKAEEYCIADTSQSNWRLPSRNEFTTIMTGSGECLLAPQLNGSCNWYWTSDQICNDIETPYLQVNFSPTDNYYKEECVYGGEEAYVRCVKKL